MHKAKVNSTTFLSRTGNHSVTHSRRGDSSHLTNEPDVSYVVDSVSDGVVAARKLRDWRDYLVNEKQALVKRMAELNAKLAETWPHSKHNQNYVRLLEKKRRIAAQLTELETQLLESKSQRKQVLISHFDGHNYSFERLFLEIAKESLPKQVWEELINAAKAAEDKLRATPTPASEERK